MSKSPQYDEYDPWVTYNSDAPLVVRRHSKRARKVTLDRVLRQVEKTGKVPTAATVKTDGTVLIKFREGDGRAVSPDGTGDVNEWDVELLQ